MSETQLQSNPNSMEEQLAERRRRMQSQEAANADRDENKDTEPMDVDGQFAENRHELEQDIVSLSSREHELQSELASTRSNLMNSRARLNVLRQADSRRSSSDPRAASESERTMTQEEKDYEIAVMLQRQFERDEHQGRRGVGFPGLSSSATQAASGSGGSNFTFSWTRSSGDGAPTTFTYSSSGGDGGDGNNPELTEQQRRLLELMGQSFGGGGGGAALGGSLPFGREPLGRGGPFGFGFGMGRPGGLNMMGGGDGFGMFGVGGTGGTGFGSGRMGRIGFSPVMFGPVGPFGTGGMNIDLDNMDHDQILRLQEMIGHVPRGATVQQLSELPTSEYQAPARAEIEEKAVDENDERRKCSICLEQFETGDEIKTLPCFHIFHADEVDRWLQQNSVCPICREPIQSRDEADIDVRDAPPL